MRQTYWNCTLTHLVTFEGEGVEISLSAGIDEYISEILFWLFPVVCGLPLQPEIFIATLGMGKTIRKPRSCNKLK